MDKQIEEILCCKKCYKTEVGLCSKPEIPEGFVVLTKEELESMVNAKMKCINDMAILTRKETAEKFAELVKMAFYYHFDELIPSIMADKIDEICNEITEGKV